MKSILILSTVLVVSLLGTSHALGLTLNVPGQYPDIDSALENAESGDIIELAPGTYYESNLRLPAGITIQGMGSGPENVTIDAERSGRIMILEGLDDPCTIRNITFRNGHAFGDNSYDQSGGAIFCSNSQASLLDCNFIANEADSHGGAVRCNNSSPIIMNCFFNDNTAANGGGGAIDCSYNSSPLLQDCVLQDNSADWGGGLSCRGDSSPEINNTTFDANIASGAAGLGGGAFADYQSKPGFTKSTFCMNRADYGGAVACLAISETNLIQCTLAFNESLVEGGGLFLNDAAPEILNTLITFNEGLGISVLGSNLPLISCTDIFGNSQGNWVGLISDQVEVRGNLSVDPQFCSQDPDDEDLFFVDGSSPVARDDTECDLMGSKPVGCNQQVADAGPVPDHPGLNGVSAWPNPFNPRTTINFELARSQRVRVSVYSMQGALVRQLADTEFGEGAQSLQWNGDDQAGRQIGSGTYVVVVEGEQDRQTLKMTMLK